VAAVTLVPADLEPFAAIDAVKAQAMIDDALALAAQVAPCILEDTFEQEGAARAILRGAVLRWNEAGTGALQSQTAGPFGQQIDTRQQRRGMFWPSEITQLQRLCAGDTGAEAFAVDTVPTGGIQQHADTCALRFGAQYCSCGAVLTQGLPLYGA
jgi:hypothetical protein